MFVVCSQADVASTAEFQGNDRFAVLTRLGQGGMGSVYQVIDRARNARVALKTVGRVAGDALLRFKREFRALQELHHPNVVELGELFEQNGEWFFTMELVSGSDFLLYTRPIDRSSPALLADPALVPELALTEIDPTLEDVPSRLVAHPLAPLDVGFDEARLRRALAQLAEAVHALHRLGHVHRDIKPGNVLVADDGRVVLIDFGLIKEARNEAHSFEHHIVGTAAYMAPELAAGRQAGPESDWYAVGVMLYESLTGVKPFAGRGLQLLLQKQTELPRRPRELVPAVPVDLDALCMDLLAIEPAARPSDREVLRRLHVDVERVRSVSLDSIERPDRADRTDSHDFVGRERELAVLDAELRRVLDGGAASVTLQGRSGLGKSALLRHFVEQIERREQGALILKGRCYEQESVPYKALDAVMDQLSHWLKQLAPTEIAPLLPEDVALLERAFPVLERVPAIARARRDVAEVRDPQLRRIRLMRTLRVLFERLGQQRLVVIVIDDYQWSDEDSQRLLDELTRPPSPPRLLLVFAMRPDEGVSTTGRLLPLEPLSSAQSLDLAMRLSSHLGGIAPARIEAVARQAEGFPFFVEAMLSQSLGPHAEEVTDLDAVIAGSIKALPAPARILLQTIACAGAPLAQSAAGEAAQVSTPDLGSQMNLLRRSKMIRTTGLRGTDRVEIYHDRIRPVVLALLEEGQRQALHGRLAEILERGAAEPERIAHHYLAAGDSARASAFLLRAAERAMGALAFGRAAALYQQAEELGQIAPEGLRRLRRDRGRALSSAGHGREAAAAFRLALDGSTRAEALELKRSISEQLFTAGFHAEGLAACREFLDEQGISYPESIRRVVVELAGFEIFLRVRGYMFETKPGPFAEESLARIDAYWAMARGLAAHDPMRAHLFQVRGLVAALDVGEPQRLSRSLSMHALAASFLDPADRPRAETILSSARALAEKLGDVRSQALVKLVEGQLDYVSACRFNRFDVAEAERLLRTKCEGVSWELNFCSISQKQCLYWTGQWKELYASVCDQIKEAEARGDRYLNVQIRSHWMSFFAAVEGDFERAHNEADFGASGGKPSPVESLVMLLSHTRVDLCEGRSDVALQRYQAYEPGLLGSLALRATIFRTMFESVRLCVLLAEARRNEGAARRRLLSEASKLSRSMVRKGVECTRPLAALGRAAIAALSAKQEEALACLDEAARGFAAGSMAAHRAATLRRRGQLLGEREGRALVEEAERWFAAQGVRDFASICRLLAPGFPVEP